MPAKLTPGRPGEGIEIASIGSAPARRGQIVEVLGGPHHEHYLVRWEDGRESIHYPSEGTRFVSTTKHAAKA
ncbi:MAG: DUF1918 domain-containing protein [Solirubrobacteraceae bacterium]